MIRLVIGIIFCVVAFVALLAKTSGPGASQHGGEILGSFLVELGIGVTLIVFGRRSLALRERIVAAAAEGLKARGEVDVASIVHETGISDSRVRKILHCLVIARFGVVMPNEPLQPTNGARAAGLGFETFSRAASG